jgi:hypothetical protein
LERPAKNASISADREGVAFIVLQAPSAQTLL